MSAGIRQTRREGKGMRTKHLIAWCTEGQHAQIMHLAKANNMTMGKLIVTLISEALAHRERNQ